MKPALPFFVVCAALIAALGVLGTWGQAPRATSFPELTLRDPAGERFDVGTLYGRIWVASFIDSGCVTRCPATVERLKGLRDGLPEDVPLVTFILGGESLWPVPIEAAAQRPRWFVAQGNDVDADDEATLRRAAVEFFGIAEGQLDGLADGTPEAWLVTVDAQGRPLEAYPLVCDDSADAAVAAAWGDVEFRVTLVRSPLREAWLYGLTTVLLIAGVVLARLEWIRPHPVCTGLATAITVILLGFGLRYGAFAISVPAHGSGWERPLYFALLTTHTASGVVIVIMASKLIFHATRKQFDRHRAIARWVAPAWICVASTGVVIYSLIGRWFPAS